MVRSHVGVWRAGSPYGRSRERLHWSAAGARQTARSHTGAARGHPRVRGGLREGWRAGAVAANDHHSRGGRKLPYSAATDPAAHDVRRDPRVVTVSVPVSRSRPLKCRVHPSRAAVPGRRSRLGRGAAGSMVRSRASWDLNTPALCPNSSPRPSSTRRSRQFCPGQSVSLISNTSTVQGSCASTGSQRFRLVVSTGKPRWRETATTCAAAGSGWSARYA